MAIEVCTLNIPVVGKIGRNEKNCKLQQPSLDFPKFGHEVIILVFFIWILRANGVCEVH